MALRRISDLQNVQSAYPDFKLDRCLIETSYKTDSNRY